MTRGITQEQSERLKKDLSEGFGVPEEEVIDYVAKILATDIKISLETSKAHFLKLKEIITNPNLSPKGKFDAIEDVQDDSIDNAPDSALMVFAAAAKKLIMTKDSPSSKALSNLQSKFDNLFKKDSRDTTETAKAILENFSAIKEDISDQKLLNALGEAFEIALNFDDNEIQNISIQANKASEEERDNEENDLESEISQEDIDLMSETSEEIDLMSETSEEMDEAETLFDDDEIQTTRTDKSLEEKNNVKTTQDDQDLEEAKKKLEEDFKAAENQKKQEEIKAEEEKKFKQDFCNNSTEKPKEKKSLWQSLKDGVEDASTNKIPRAIGAVILGDFAALSVGGALGGPVGVAVVYLFWQLTKDSKEVEKSADKVYDVNAEANEYKKEREEIRNYIAETSAGKAASQVEAETIKEMEEQKDELKSSKNTISGVREMDEVKKVAQSLRASGVSEHEEDDNKTVVSVNNEPKGLGR